MLIGNFLLDLTIIAAIGGGLYLGWSRGFIRVVLKRFSGLFSAVLAFQFFERLAAVLKDKYVLSFIKEGLTNALSGATDEITAEGMTSAVPASLTKLASIVGIDLTGMAEKAMENGKNAVSSFVDSASNSISQLLSAIVAFMLLFCGFVFVLRVLSLPLSKVIMKIPVVGTANRALGLLFGALATLIIAWVAIQLIGFLDETIGLKAIEVSDSAFSGMFYRFHIFS